MKGIRKNVFVLKCSKDSPFESAFFVLKSDSAEAVESSIIAEAERLVEGVLSDNPIPCKSTRKNRKKAK